MAKVKRTKKARVINCTCKTTRSAGGKVYAGTDCVCRVISNGRVRDIPSTTVAIIPRK